ncbi:MAG TPA: phosphotransferase, partial [Ktedonobacterales bacterium]|nr:phosphotransferase [Ktedonobacterales bacterium]
RASPMAQGSNNQVWRIETPAGAYALTVYANHADARRLGFVRDVLVGVQDAGLPFAVPAPVATRTGAYYVELAPSQEAADDAAAGDDATQPTLATLAPLIPGDHPRRDDLAQAITGGAALGLLDQTLAGLAGLQTPEAGVCWRSYGDLAHCHPLVPDPVAAIAALAIADDVRRPLADHCAELMARMPDLYASLPQQLCHEDYSPDNLLMEGERMTGVLDFEFCARDVRVMDLTVALSWWPIAQFGSGDEWPIIRAVVQGYARHITLTQDEVEAIPTLFQLRAYTSLIHRLGRYRQGISPLPAVADRAEAALAREDWLRANGERFVEIVAEMATGMRASE